MEIKKIIERLGLKAKDLKPYLLSEIDEFLETKDPEEQIKEFHDIIFALKNISYAHTGKHIEINSSIYENKVEGRLKDYATISKKEPLYTHPRIKKIPIGVLHISFGNFKQPWSNFDPFKNGTEAEIAMLTDNEFKKRDSYTNHAIITFDKTEKIEYKFLTSSWNKEQNNTILCRIPDFIYKNSKEHIDFSGVEEFLSYQVFSTIKNLTLKDNCIFHFHSWESALAIHSEEFKNLVKGHKKIFSPYLTVSRLKEFLMKRNKYETTLNKKELDVSSDYEKEMVRFSDRTVVESNRDKHFYERLVKDKSKIKIYSYSNPNKHIIKPREIKSEEITFVAGGRPVYEKGFHELLKELPKLIEYFEKKNMSLNLKIFCKEYDRSTNELKKKEYINTLKTIVNKFDLDNHVEILDKVSINQLQKEINDSYGLIVPSLYDPYCLMPNYAIKENRVSYVSKYTGISENITSEDYIFDPLKRGSLIDSVKKTLNDKPEFILHNKNTDHKKLYLE